MTLAVELPNTSRRLWCHRCGWTSWNSTDGLKPRAGDTCPQCKAAGPQHHKGAVLRWARIVVTDVEPLPGDTEGLF